MKPWYKHFWFWFVIAPPAASIVAGLSLVYIALGNADDLVVDDYRKIGRAFEQQTERDRSAVMLNAGARMSLDREDGSVVLLLALDGDLPATLALRAIHPTEQRRDLAAVLTLHEAGVYHGRFDRPPRDRRYLQLEPAERSWRLTAELQSDAEAAVFATTQR